MEQALQFLRDLRGPLYQVPLIAFIGNISRTWYVDEDMIGIVMDILRTERPFRPVHTRPVGFDLVIKAAADRLGLESYEVEPIGEGNDGRDLRDPAMLDGVAMVVAFPAEKAPPTDKWGETIKAPNVRQIWETADPLLSEVVGDMGLPVLVVYRTGETVWVAPQKRTA